MIKYWVLLLISQLNYGILTPVNVCKWLFIILGRIIWKKLILSDDRILIEIDSSMISWCLKTNSDIMKFDQNKLVCCSYDGTVKIWEWISGECTQTYESN